MQITLDEIATIRTIQAHGTTILQGLADIGRDEKLELDLSNVNEADLSFVQLVEAARLQACQEGKALQLASPAPAALRALLERAGFLTAPSAEDLAFWFHEGGAQ